ncbi:MAG TPA: coproporphyrinogen-III oxidase family protein [Candidatus Rifleibacterium sp.]|nr:coproporphyrinogen-III oxidase family protein [Candidatus Rifleibacterium sp.]HPT44892.1 coproporphyrinogen-III oxidase family protein [Candidatus Rifleibacterium sp.]
MTGFVADSAGLYLHVPFCLSKCDYCGFYSTPPQAGDIDRYLARLAEESAATRARWPAAISTVFVGGGNPTASGFLVVRRLVEIIQTWCSPTPPLEITFETNPETLTAETVDFLASLPGVRLSIGVQRLDDAELALLGRHARLDSVHRALDLACSRLKNVGIDLILGVPGCPSLTAALGGLLQRFGLQHVSAYFLTVEENTPMQKRIEAGLLPDPAEIGPEEMFAVRDLLVSNGFEHYEISNYARPGRRCLHNLNYWQAGDYIGLGPSAVSCCGNRRSANPPDLQRWLHAEPQEVEMLSDTDRRNEFLMLNLRLLNDGLALPALAARFGPQPPEFEHAWLRQVSAGNLKQVGDRLLLTDQGLAVADQVLASMFI